MPEVLNDLAHLPTGSHAIAFYASREEAAEQAADFLAGSPDGQAASFWVADASLVPLYSERLAVRAPEQVGCVHVLDHEQVQPMDGKLRPVAEVLDFVGSHPDGVTGGADTITEVLGAVERARTHRVRRMVPGATSGAVPLPLPVRSTQGATETSPRNSP